MLWPGATWASKLLITSDVWIVISPHPARRPERVCLWSLIAVVGLVMLLGEGLALAKRYGELYQWSRNPDEFYAHYPEPIPGEHLENEMRVINLLKRDSRSRPLSWAR